MTIPIHHLAMRATSVLSLLAILGARVQAQAAAPSSLPAHRTTITLNPIATVVGFFTGDVETAVAPTVTIGVGWSITGLDDFDEYRALDAKVRYWVNGKVLDGFAVTGMAGVASSTGYFINACSYDSFTQTCRLTRSTRATIGTELSYQWLLGPTRRFVVVAGAGAKRYLGNQANSSFDAQFLPTGRANVGFRF